MAVSGGIGIILSVCSIGDNENLHILIQSTCRPKTVSLIAFDLIKCFTDRNATAFQFHMDKGKSVDKDSHIIACVVLALGFLVLVDNL